ncbi:fibronectin type III domain-containing protein, partial [bacterium]|nr:fibronectin type III domain-containing protein [bacterium]
MGNSSITWSYIKSRNADNDNNNSGINLPALMLQKQSEGSKVTSSSIPGGISDFSVKLYKGFTGAGNREVELFVNGVSKGTSTPFDDFNEHIFSVPGINVSGDVVIELVNTRSKQVIVDDISVTSYTAPTTSTINLNTTGGSYPGERWANITTGINNTGTEVWGQNSCTFSSYTASGCRGALVNTDVDIAPGTYYVNCFDSYGDGWGSGNNFTVTAYGSTLASANVGDDDASGNNLEVSLMIVVPAAPSCLPPTALTATNLTPTSADLAWTAGGSETVWELSWGVQGITPATGTLVPMVNPNPTTSLTGLTANTAYDFYVKADCGFGTGSTDLSAWAGPYTFTTACASYTAPYSQNFDATTAPAIDGCWNPIVTPASSSYDIRTYTSSFSTAYYNSSPNSIRFYNGFSTTEMILASPEFSDLDNTKRIKFFVKDNASSTSTYTISDLIVGTMSDPNDATTFTAYQTVLNSTFAGYSWVEVIVNFDNYTGTDKYIGLKHGLNTSTDYIYVDDFVYEAIPSCLAPTAITPSNETATSADFSWTAGAAQTAWNVEYGVDGFVRGGGTGTTVAVTTNPYSITGLTANTDYDIYIQADCGNGDVSGWVGPVSFTTLCAAVIPNYTQGFDTYPGDCWSEANGPTPSGTTSGWTVDGFGNVGSTGSARVEIYYTGGDEWLVTPTFDLSSGGYEINLDVALTDYYSTAADVIGGDDAVYLMQSVDDGLNWTTIYTWDANNSPSNTGDNVTVDISTLTSATTKFALFMLEGSSSGGDVNFYVDNFAVRTPPNCLPPTNLVASNVTASSADFTWVTGGTGNVYNFDYGTPGFTPGTGTSSVINASTTIAANPNSLFTSGNANWPHVFTACLIADGNTTQTAQTVTINVTSLPSGGTNYQIFKTLAPGATPGQFYSSATPLTLGLNTLTVSAVTATPPYDRSVKFRFSNDQFEFDAISLNGVSVYGPNTSITGLTAETTYEAYVQEDCGATNNGLSSWTGPVSFTTGCNAVADFSENFDAATAIPNCFGTIVVGTSNTGVTFNAPTSGNNSIYLKKYQSPETATLLLPLVTT